MRRRNSILVLLALLINGMVPYGALAEAHTLSLDEFLAAVRNYHPVAVQSRLMVDGADAAVTMARGGFDPVISSVGKEKTYSGKQYYSYFNAGVTVPTWYGIDLKAGVEEVYGGRVTPEATLGKTSYVGVKVPATGLLFDKRRAQLRQAQQMAGLSRAERDLAVNNLVYNAGTAYWSWVRAYYTYKVYDGIVEVSRKRFAQVKLEYFQGARPAIDTTEALLQLQSFELQREGALLSFNNEGLEMANYLWVEGGEPVAWADNVFPDNEALTRTLPVLPLEDALALVREKHPKLLALQHKIGMLGIERRLKMQYLLPKLSLSGSLLGKGYTVADGEMPYLLENNRKIGFDFSMPLFLREARGGYRASGIKIEQTETEQQLALRQLENKVKSYYNEIVTLSRQVQMFGEMLTGYERMLRGEQTRFDVGESTVFLVNSRETKLLEAQLKVYELRTKLQKSHLALMWAAGNLY